MSEILVPDKTTEETPENESSKTSARKLSFKLLNKKVVRVLLVIIVVIVAIGFGLTKKEEIFDRFKKSNEITEEEVRDLVFEVSKIIQLPEGETPTIATVSDLEQLGDQDFFRNAQVGDKILIYESIKRAYLYRPGVNKIIEVGKVTLGSGEGLEENEKIEIITPTPIEEVSIGTPSATPSFSLTPTTSPTPTKTTLPTTQP